MKKRILSILITLVMLIGLVSVMSIGASAETVTEYGLSIGGVPVTDANKDDIDVPGASGSATYDPDTKTLTLNNFSCSSDAFGGVINIQDGDITIKLKGNNTLTGTDEYTDGIYTNGNLAICNGEDGVAQGQLTINTVSSCINAPAGTLEITDVKVTAESTEDYGLYAESISLSGVTLSATAYYGAIETRSEYLGGPVFDPVTGLPVFDPEAGEPVEVYGAINIENSTVEAYCTSGWNCYAFMPAPTITGTFDVYAGNDAASALKVDSPTDATYTTRKYVKIEPVKYDLWVGGVQVTSANKDNIVVPGAAGSATYDPATHTLTLNNFSYTGEGYNYSGNAGALIYSTGIDLKIVLKDTNTFTSIDRYQKGIMIENGSLTIANSDADDVMGSLQLTAVNPVICVDNGSLFVENVNLTVINTASPKGNPGEAILVIGDISITNSDVKAISGDSNGDDIPEEGATFGISTMGSISVTNSIVSATGYYGGMWANSLSVTNSIVTAAGDWGALCVGDSYPEGCLVPTLNGEFTVTAGNDAASAVKVDSPTDATYANKYVKIEPVKYDLWVAGVQLTGTNLVIDSTDNAAISGSATYDPATHTLTLNNFSYTGEGYNYTSNVRALIYSTGIDLKIVLKGTNTFADIDRYQEGIIIENGSLTIANSDADDVMGSLQLTAEYPVIGVNNGSLFVENVNLTVINTASPTANPGVAILATGDISITNSDVTAISGDSNGDNIPESGATIGIGAMGSISVTNSIVSATGGGGGMWANRLSVTNSIVTAAGDFGALIAADSSLVPTLNGEFTVTAGNDAASATEADASADATYANKYVKIEPKIHTHCICGETHASVGNHDAEVSTTFTAVTNQTELQNAATNGGNVYLANDIELTADIIVAGNLNLCLNGYSITPADSRTDGRAITVNIGATFVLTDCGDGCISGFMTSTHINGNGVYNEGTFTMYAGAIGENSSNGHGGGVYNKGTFTMYGGTIRNNEMITGGWYGGGAGVHQRAGSFTMYGGTITGNKTVGTGGGVYYLGGTFTMHGGTITDNEAEGSGGGVYHNGGTFTMYGGTIGENCANSGGGVYGNYFAMHGGSVINNTATTYGGGIYSYNGTLELSGSVTITGNEVNEEQSDIYIGYTVITIKDDFTPTSAIGVTKHEVVGTIVRAADGETLDIEDYKQYFVGEEGIPFYVAGDALELGYTITEEPDDTNNHTVKTNGDANASYQWAKYGLIAHPVVYESYAPMSLRSVTPMPGMEDAFGVEAALVNDCGYWGDDYWDYYPNYDAENKYWIASNNVVDDGDARECYHKFDASYFIIIPKKNGTLSVTLIDPLDNGEELALYIMDGEGHSWLVEEVTPNADGSYSLTAGISYRLLIKDSDDTNNGTYEGGFNDTFPKLTATFTAMGASELLDGQNEATLDITGLGSGAYICKTSWDIYDTPADAEDDYYLVSAPVTRYGVIFDYGTLGSETKTVSSGETVTPPAPVFAGKVLVGWYTDSNFTTEFNFSDAITADNTTIYAKFADYEGDKEALNNKINAAKSDLQAKIDAVNSALAGKADAATLAQAIADLNTAKTNIQNLLEQIDDYANADTALKAELITKIETADNHIHTAISDLTSRVQTLESELAAATSDISTNASEVVQLTADLAALNTSLTDLNNKLTNDYATKAELTNAINSAKATINSTIDALTIRVQNLEAGLAAADSKIDTNTSDVGTLKSDVAALKTWKTEAQNAIIALQNLTNTQDTNISALQTAVANLDNALTKANDKITAAEVRIAALEGRVSELETAKQELDAAVATLNAAIANKADTATLNQKVGELNTAIAKAEATAKEYTDGVVRNLRAAIIAAKDEAVNVAKDLVDAAKAELQAAIDNKADITTVNTAIANLQNAITALQNAKDNYIAADTALKAELEDAIAKAKQEAIDAAKGYIPYIGTNGNWWIGATDTLVDANGIKGDKGDTGAQGADGVGIAKIEKTSSDGNVDTYTITMTDGTTYTFTVTNGTNGTDGKDGVDGKDGTNGTNGVDGKDGTDGEDGQTPYIGENGNWWIGDTDTGVKAAGDDGKDGAIIIATAVGGTALISNIALIAWTLIKKKRLF